jgi:hypothetical protein
MARKAHAAGVGPSSSVLMAFGHKKDALSRVPSWAQGFDLRAAVSRPVLAGREGLTLHSAEDAVHFLRFGEDKRGMG